MNRPLVIYHDHCTDGWTAAYIARCVYPDAELFPATYGDAPPDVNERDVLIVDFSYPRETLLELRRQARTLRVLDHHKTAKADLEGLEFCTFDMDQSGAGLTYRTLIDDQPSQLVLYVEDRDLWRFKLPHSQEINALIGSTERTLEAWENLEVSLETRFAQCVAAGRAALNVTTRYVEAHKHRARLCVFEGRRVPVINSTFAISDLVGALAEGHAFAVGWFQRQDGQFVYSLRSSGDGIDVSAVAKCFGGGGHKNAAGFTLDHPLPFYPWTDDQAKAESARDDAGDAS